MVNPSTKYLPDDIIYSENNAGEISSWKVTTWDDYFNHCPDIYSDMQGLRTNPYWIPAVHINRQFYLPVTADSIRHHEIAKHNQQPEPYTPPKPFEFLDLQ